MNGPIINAWFDEGLIYLSCDDQQGMCPPTRHGGLLVNTNYITMGSTGEATDQDRLEPDSSHIHLRLLGQSKYKPNLRPRPNPINNFLA